VFCLPHHVPRTTNSAMCINSNSLPSTLTPTPTLTHVYAGSSAEHHTWPHRDSLSSTRILLQRMLSTRQAQKVPLDSFVGISETRQAFERLPPGERAEKAHLTLVCSIDGDVNHLHRFDSQKRRWQRKKRKLLLLLRWW